MKSDERATQLAQLKQFSLVYYIAWRFIIIWIKNATISSALL